VRACEENDLVFIGPPADVMERMGRQGAGETRDAGCGCAARTRHGPATASLDEARIAAAELGYPVLLKAGGGGGGRGMRLVSSETEIDEATLERRPRPRLLSPTAISTSRRRSRLRDTSRSR